MRAALISIVNQPRDELQGTSLSIAGRTLARRQLDFAIAAGSERIIVLGDGATSEAIALRHAAEEAGARFQVVTDAGGVLGTIKSEDELLILMPGLLPESRLALEVLAANRVVLVLPPEAAISSGFERIDLERAWAGALVLPGSHVEKLAELPDDSDPHAALLRISLQAQFPETRLPETEVSEGNWTMPHDPAEAEANWLRRNAPKPPSNSVTGALAHFALLGLVGKLLKPDQSLQLLNVGAIVTIGLALAAAWFAVPWLGFLLICVAALLAELSGKLFKLHNAPFRITKDNDFAETYLPILVDLALIGVAVVPVDHEWLTRFFPPLAMVAALHATRLDRSANAAALLADRGLLALVLAVAAVFGLAGPAIMVLVLAILALKAAQNGPLRG